MKFIDIVSGRKSVRKFLHKPIERHNLVQCIEAARLAPSADNMQPWRFIVLEDTQIKKHFCHEVTRGIYRRTRFIETAPVVIVLVAKLHFVVHRIGKIVSRRNIELIDMGIAGEHLVLQAQELGIGTCWVNMFDVKRAQRVLGLPKSYKVISLIAMGYPAEGSTRNRPRHPLERILFFNSDYMKGLR